MTLDSVLVTGCSAGGIGSEIAIEFQKQGLHVFATARDVNKLAHFKDLAMSRFFY
jgi:1-acylglycerone phosphate reductase